MSKKGSEFERETCRLLSLWWSNGRHDDLFWRTATSGARATARAKKGKKTRSHAADICATDEVGLPLTRYVCLELKKGFHGGATVQDLLDSRKGTPKYREWIDKTRATARAAGVPHWMVIHCRDRREQVVLFPHRAFPAACGSGLAGPSLVLTLDGRGPVVMCRLADFFAAVSPREVRRLSRRHHRRK